MLTLADTDFRTFFAHLPTSVTAIIARDGANPFGMIVGSFASVSLDPPLVSVMVMRDSYTWSRIRAHGRFTANILASDQRDVCQTIASRAEDKWSRVPFAGTTVIDRCLGWVDCEIESEVDAGDHLIVLARPGAMHIERGATAPLVFMHRGYHRTLAVEDVRSPEWF